MKRFFVPLIFSFLTCAVFAGDSEPQSTPAAEAAAKQGADERYERMAADIQALQAANEALGAKVATLQQQRQDLRNQQSQQPANAATSDDLRRLAGKIEEVDR